MKKVTLIILYFILFPLDAYSVTLKSALKLTYENNLELQAERKNLEVQKEVLNISKSDFLPTLTLTGKKNFEETSKLTNQSGGDASISDVNTLSSSIKIEQTLLDGQGRNAEYEKSKLGLNLSEAQFIKKEQEIFLKAIESYTGLILAYEKLSINKENVNLLQRQFEIDHARLSRAQITAADLAQSQSSLAGAQARYIEAQNNIVTGKLSYENVIGPINNQEKLKKIYKSDETIPSSLTEAMEISGKNSPELIIAEIEYGQSELDVKIARSDLSPTAKLSLENNLDINNAVALSVRVNDILRLFVYPIFGLLSLFFIRQVWIQKTLYPRWIIVFFPLLLFLLEGVITDHVLKGLFVIVQGGYLNLILIVFFTASTIALWNPIKSDENIKYEKTN